MINLTIGGWGTCTVRQFLLLFGTCSHFLSGTFLVFVIVLSTTLHCFTFMQSSLVSCPGVRTSSFHLSKWLVRHVEVFFMNLRNGFNVFPLLIAALFLIIIKTFLFCFYLTLLNWNCLKNWHMNGVMNESKINLQLFLSHMCLCSPWLGHFHTSASSWGYTAACWHSHTASHTRCSTSVPGWRNSPGLPCCSTDQPWPDKHPLLRYW